MLLGLPFAFVFMPLPGTVRVLGRFGKRTAVPLNGVGQNAVRPRRGDWLNPGVIFSAPGDITVTVQGQNIPNGTFVLLLVTMVGSVKEYPHPASGHPLPSDGRGTAAGEPNVLLSGGTATFTLTVPRGREDYTGVCGIHSAAMKQLRVVGRKLKDEMANHERRRRDTNRIPAQRCLTPGARSVFAAQSGK
jgi:hypothetical protein